MNPVQKFTIAPYNGNDDVARQESCLGSYIFINFSDFEANGNEVDLAALDEYCIQQNVEIKNCGCYALSMAIEFGDEAIINHIFEAIKGDLEITMYGETPLLYVMPMLNRAPAAFPTMRKLVEGGAHVNTVMGKGLRPHLLISKGLPDHATPLYIAIEKTKHIPAAMLLLKHQAFAHPALSGEGEKLLAKCHWVESSGKLLFMCLFTKELIFRDYDLCIDVTGLITRLSFTLD